MAYHVTAEMDKALDKKSMPDGKDWMNIAPHIVINLTDEQVRNILLHLLTGGQSEHNTFYDGLVLTLGEERCLQLIELAKQAT